MQQMNDDYLSDPAESFNTQMPTDGDNHFASQSDLSDYSESDYESETEQKNNSGLAPAGYSISNRQMQNIIPTGSRERYQNLRKYPLGNYIPNKPIPYHSKSNDESETESETDTESEYSETSSCSEESESDNKQVRQRNNYKSTSLMSVDELKKLNNPVAIKKYKKAEQKSKPKVGRPRGSGNKQKVIPDIVNTGKSNSKEVAPTDVVCQICGKTVKRKYMASHRRSQFHKSHDQFNQLIKNMLNNPNTLMSNTSKTRSTKKKV